MRTENVIFCSSTDEIKKAIGTSDIIIVVDGTEEKKLDDYFLDGINDHYTDVKIFSTQSVMARAVELAGGYYADVSPIDDTE